MMQTDAIVISEPGRVELRTVALTDPGPEDVIIQTAYTSISAGTERMLLAGRMPHPMLSFPVVPGYETVGRVVGLGAQVPPELEGRWVYVGGARCYTDVNPAWGGQARQLIVDHRRVVTLDPIDPRQGVLLALAATALHGIDLLASAPNDRVLVLGQGPVGQIAARVARSRGAWVAVADKVPSRLERAAADLLLDARAGGLREQLGGPVAAIIEATGSMAALAEALPLLADGGTILLLGYYDELRLPYMPLFLKQARLLTAREWGPGDLVRCRDMIANGILDVAGLLTHRVPVQQFEEGYRVALEDPECLKLVLEW
jgi:3-hydroxyethyl bacteriochlorophyllide a dehydrogenase